MVDQPAPREWPCVVCNVPGRTVANHGEPCEHCREAIADWDDPGVPTPSVHEILPPRYRDRDGYDALQDRRAEESYDTRPTVKELLRADIEAHHYDTYYRRSARGRHPFGLPTVPKDGRASAGLPSASAAPDGLRPSPPSDDTGTQARRAAA